MATTSLAEKIRSALCQLSRAVTSCYFWRVKPFKLLLLIGLVVVGLIYAALMLERIFTPAVSDSDLAVTRKNVTDTANGVKQLELATAELWWPEDLRAPLNELAQGTNWDAALAASVLSNNTASLTALDAALRSREFQVPEYHFGVAADYLTGWKGLAHLATVRIYATFKAGKEREAFAQALDLIQLANRMQAANGPILDYLVGTAVKNIGLSAVRTLTPSTQLSPEELTALAIELPRVAGNFGALTNALKVEYQAQKQYAVDLREGKITGPSRIAGVGMGLLPIYNVRRTQTKFAANTRKLLQALNQPFVVGHATVTNNARPSIPQLLLGGNAVGDVIYLMTTPAIDGVLRQKSAEHLQVQTTATLLAMKAYQSKNGRLPAELKELVPQFLPALPMDDFDGKNLRYAPEKKLLYSVSTNGKDDGGTETEARKHEPDWVFPIGF